MFLSQKVTRGFVLAASLGALTACGSDSSTSPTGGSSKTLSSAEAQAVSVALFNEINKAWSSATVTTGDLAPSMSLAAAAASATAPTTFKETIKGTCTNGGTITGTVNVTSDLNGSSTGSESATMNITAAGCKVSTGTQVIAIDGSLNYSFSVAFANGKASAPYVWKGSGNWTWTGGSCAMDYTISYDLNTGHGSENGSFCGSTINATF